MTTSPTTAPPTAPSSVAQVAEARDAQAPALAETGPLNALGWVMLLFRLCVAGLFLFAAYHKLWGELAPQVFSDSVRAFKVTTSEFATRMATSVTPWVEVVASVCLLIPRWSRAAATTLSLMLVMFIVVIRHAIVNNFDLECGCFGDLSPFCPRKVSSCNIIQNAILLAMSLAVALIPRHRLVRTVRAV